jgi:hypothetical protein
METNDFIDILFSKFQERIIGVMKPHVDDKHKIHPKFVYIHQDLAVLYISYVLYVYFL